MVLISRLSSRERKRASVFLLISLEEKEKLNTAGCHCILTVVSP